MLKIQLLGVRWLPILLLALAVAALSGYVHPFGFSDGTD
jgi:hypothetical protein